MTSNPKRWVIKPFSPKLEQLDLRSILSPTDQPQSLEKTWSSRKDDDSFNYSLESTTVTGMQPTVMVSSESGKSTPEVVVQARQVSVSEDGSDSEDWRPSTPSNPSSPNSSTGSHVGFYSFVDDPASPEAELNKVYMVSPTRQAKLNTLKQKNTFKLQTYTEGNRPGRLFEETNGDDLYRVEEASTEENPDRIEIIRNQAPKKSPALKEQWSALENLDLSNTPQRLLDGFSLLYKPVSAKTEQARVEPEAIDKEQIDFNAARKQFLIMEQSKKNAFQQSHQHLPYSPKMRGRTMSSTASIFTPKEVSKENSLEENQFTLASQQKTEVNTVTVTEDQKNGVLSVAIDDVESDLGELTVGYTSNERISNDPSISEMGSSLALLSTEETPIQREIRISREREEDLRRSRGILRTDISEMVEIRTKPILSFSSSQIKAAKSKEPNKVSFLIQRELELDKQQQFPIPDHNQKNQALEKKSAFESHPQEIPNISLKASQRENELEQRTDSADDMWITEQPVLLEEGDLSDTKEVLSPCCPHRHPDESTLQRSTDCSTSRSKVQIGPYSEKNDYSKVRVYNENGVDSQNSNPRRQKKYSWNVENDNNMLQKNRVYSPTILSQLNLEKTRYSPSWRSHLEPTNWKPKMQNAPDSIRQEIEEDLRREQELQELREFISVPNSAVTSLKTSSKPRSPLIGSEENLLSPETPKRHIEEVDSMPPEKKTDHSSPYSWSLATSSVFQLSMADKSQQMSSPLQNSRLPSMSIITPQPWGNQKPMSPTVSLITPIKPLSAPVDMLSPTSQKGLTETLLKDFEDRKIKLKLEESAYAGIQPIDAINNEVVEATRVTRHKNQRALQWEAGMYANQESE
ncbi:mitotic interactor and substrate of PLK1 isoform X2 [Danio rerio]|nr:mitotic interactor and substrate of PLK1 isoform X2 [Danio rerio]XP_021335620.1 mitotic interactor and substrate of PLK1 isoform X2 [Danio rerio]|eukprot:XP_021335619.1 mitotic interactor and substrate of PLK1 isoform X2 [Danio rerio]